MEHKKTRKECIEEKIPFLEGRPQRQHAINHDDIIDLEIILNTNDSIDAIIEQL
jgi:hypothetical protein